MLRLLPLLLLPSSSSAAAKVPSYPHCRKVTGNKNPEDEETVPCYSGLCLAEKCEGRLFILSIFCLIVFSIALIDGKKGPEAFDVALDYEDSG